MSVSSSNLIVRSLTSASNLAQRELCPGSAAAEEGRPNTDNEDSIEGTFLHACDADGTTEGTTEEQRLILEIAAQGDEQIFKTVEEKYLIAEDEPFIEGREDERLFRKGLKPLFPGHNDRWRFYTERKILVIIDKKFGRNEVTSADANVQLRAYAVMGSDEFKPETVIVAINQPRKKREERITIGEYSSESIEAARAHIVTIWEGSHNKDGSPRQDVPRIASEDACRYCKAKLDCDAYAAKVTLLAPEVPQGKEAFVAKLGAITDEQLDQVYQAIKFADLIADAAKEEILKRIESGGMAGYSTSPSGFTTTITDNPTAIRLLTEHGFTVGQIARPLTMTDLTKVVAAARDLTEKNAKQFVSETLSSVIEKKPKAPILKRAKNLLK